MRNVQSSLPGKGLKKIVESLGWSSRPYRELIAPPDKSVPEKIRRFLRKEEANGFESYDRVPDLFDDTYENSVKPFLKTLP